MSAVDRNSRAIWALAAMLPVLAGAGWLEAAAWSAGLMGGLALAVASVPGWIAIAWMASLAVPSLPPGAAAAGMAALRSWPGVLAAGAAGCVLSGVMPAGVRTAGVALLAAALAAGAGRRRHARV